MNFLVGDFLIQFLGGPVSSIYISREFLWFLGDVGGRNERFRCFHLVSVHTLFTYWHFSLIQRTTFDRLLRPMLFRFREKELRSDFEQHSPV